MKKTGLLCVGLALCLLCGCASTGEGDGEHPMTPLTTTDTAATTTGVGSDAVATTTTTTATAATTAPAAKTTVKAAATTTTTAKQTVAANAQPVTATYIQGILVVNKTYPLPENYAPGVDPQAQQAMDELLAAAKQDGMNLWVQSSYRSYQHQKSLYERYCARDGQAAADRYSARPGHSEHQSGLAFDFNTIDMSFAATPECTWLKENCWKYGFIIRYEKDKEAITGYQYEPWHVRYLGKEVAKSVYDSGLCLEEYLGITSQYAD